MTSASSLDQIRSQVADHPLVQHDPEQRAYIAGSALCPLLTQSHLAQSHLTQSHLTQSQNSDNESLHKGMGGWISLDADDFHVHEIPAYPPTGEGSHWMIHLLKENLTTDEAIKLLAQSCKIEPSEIGYAGRKDKYALTSQWMTLPCPPPPLNQPLYMEGEDRGLTLLSATPHQKKLKLGHLRGNLFSILIRDVHSPQSVSQLIHLTQKGIPNYFGRQRFGQIKQFQRLEDNLDRALFFLFRNLHHAGVNQNTSAQESTSTPSKKRFKKRKPSSQDRLLLSALQSALFNLWVGQRIRDDLFYQVIEGDVCRKKEGGTFYSTEPDIDTERLQRGEIEILGPMFGPKMFPSRGKAFEREQQLLNQWGMTEALLQDLGRSWKGDRRSLKICPMGLSARQYQDQLTQNHHVHLRFILDKGSYATTLLTELIQPQNAFERRPLIP